MKALAMLNRSCHEVGVCSRSSNDVVGIKHARLMHQDKGLAVLTAVYQDGVVSSCTGKIEGGKFKPDCCYSTEAGQEEAYWAWVAHLAAVGYKEQAIEVEKEAK